VNHRWCGWLVALVLLPGVARGAAPALGPAGADGTVGAGQYRPVEGIAQLPPDEKWRLLRRQIRYVFVIFQENRSFDHYFGTYPGADGLFANGHLRHVPGAVQRIRNTDGSFADISPFLIPRSITDAAGHTVPLFPEDTHTVNHFHDGMLHGLHLDAATHRIARNDGHALAQERLFYAGDASADAGIVGPDGTLPAQPPTLAQKQTGELAMAHVDCDTVPFLWQYADRFTLFDDFHATALGPSTPNAIAMIAGQTGETQWALHPEQADPVGLTLPNVADAPPYGGSDADPAGGALPYGVRETRAHGQRNLTFATLPLSLFGGTIEAVTQADPNPAANLADVRRDIAAIAAQNRAVPWGWYQQGFGAEPFDGTTTPDNIAHPPHASYVVHHSALQYFGYLAGNPRVRAQMHGLQAFFDAVAARRLPEQGGVFYVRGGYYNNDGLLTLNPNPAIRARFAGNDDHPAYSDAQISEAMVADAVNAIASSPYWPHSAIIITYDETDGLYDHVPPRIRTFGPDGMPLAGGPRIPAIIVSPFSAAHAVAHDYSEHSSVIRFIDRLFGLIPLAQLPDEQRGRELGRAQAATFHQDGLGPADALPEIGDLSAAFDDDRLRGAAPPLPASYATIPRAVVTTLPHYGGAGCRALNIVPTDYLNGRPVDPPPPDFNPRPYQSPGIPTAGNWTP
jgi:phospholipase C